MPTPEILNPFALSDDPHVELGRAVMTAVESIVVESGIIATSVALAHVVPHDPQAAHFIQKTAEMLTYANLGLGGVVTFIHMICAASEGPPSR